VPELTPFPALRYDPSVITDIGAVLCPPYDVIGPTEREALALLPYNAVHLELPEPDDDDGRSSPYSAAATRLAGWQAQGVLRLDDRPMVYLYEQVYRLPGSPVDGPLARARGLYCRLSLEEPGRGVLRHERTMSRPKEDRFALLSATQANLSPVLMLYRSADEGRASAELIERLGARPPIVETLARDVEHRLWAIDPAASADAARLLELAAAGPLAIADGHHRYETALRYRDQVGGLGSEHVLVLLYDAQTGGLGVLATHRLLHRSPETEPLLTGLREVGRFEPVAEPELLGQAMANGGIGVWTRHGGGLLSLGGERMASLLPEASESLRALDVTALAAALEHVLGASKGTLGEQGRISYVKDADEAIARVGDGSADACFLLNPTPVQAVLDVAAAGELMPPKSTYFVPKAATGLVFNVLSA
jgi:uncharacterized protein (DUF1015 family)